MTTFSMSEHKHGLFAVMPNSKTPAEAGGLLLMRLLTNNADSQKSLSASNDLIAKVESLSKAKKDELMAVVLDVTVGKPLADKHTTEGTDNADTVYRYKCTVGDLFRRAIAIREMHASDIKPEIVQEPSATGGRKQGGSLASGLLK